MFLPNMNSAQISNPGLPTSPTGSTVQAKSNARMLETAKEFEATILTMLLKDMRQSLEPDTMFPGDSSDIQGGLFDMYLGRHLADSGGMGLAATVARQLQATADTKKTSVQLDAARSVIHERSVPAAHLPQP